MKTNVIICLLLLSLTANSQTTIEYLDINNVKAGFLNTGDMFWNPDSSAARYEFPKGSGKHSNFTGSLWVSGIHGANNTLHVSAQTYRQNGNDYWSGPLENGITDSTTASKWDKIWKINKASIDSFINTSPHTLANTADVILHWPAKGNIYAEGKNGATLMVNKDLAPFIDINNDGIYNALDGDYPNIKGEQALWWIFNDFHPHEVTGSNSLHLEIMNMAYACYSISGIKNAIYLDMTITNNDSVNYNNTRFSFVDDFDIGYAFDDYVGSDSIRRMGIGYNGDNFDDTLLSLAYGNSLTQFATILLKSPGDSVGYKEPLGGLVYFNNDNTVMGNPEVDTQYVHLMTNKWRDGIPFTDVGNARVPGNVVHYIYPSEPNAAAGISERQFANIPADRRFLLNTRKFTMQAGKSYSFNLAFLNSPVGSSNVDFSILKSYADTVIQFDEGCSSTWPLSVQSTKLNKAIVVFPNPADDFLEIKADQEDLNHIRQIEIINIDGQKSLHNIFQPGNKIDIHNLAKGVYVLRLIGKDQQLLQRFTKL